MTEEELMNYLNRKPTTTVSQTPLSQRVPSKFEAAMRGAAQGATMGLQPEIAAGLSTGFGTLGDYKKSKIESMKANDAAFSEHPITYGTGYAGGTIGSMALGPGLAARGAGALKGAVTTAAGKGLGPEVIGALKSSMSQNPLGASYETLKGAAPVWKEAMENGSGIVPRLARGELKMPMTGGRVGLTGTNAARAGMLGGSTENALYPGDKGISIEDLNNTALPEKRSDAAPYGKLLDYLKMAQGSSPEVMQMAEVAQQGNDSEDPVVKRRMAMELQSTPQGRAVTNTDSDQRRA